MQCRGNPRRREPLSHQELIQAGVFGGVRDARAPAQLLLQRLRNECAFVHVREDLRQGLIGNVAGNPHRAQLTHHAQSPAALYVSRRARVRPRHTSIV